MSSRNIIEKHLASLEDWYLIVCLKLDVSECSTDRHIFGITKGGNRHAHYEN